MDKSKISDHYFKKGVFITPFNQIENLQLQSWNFKRLPTYIWLGLIIKHYGHTIGLEKCFKIVKFLIKDLSVGIDYPMFHLINRLNDKILERFYDYILTEIDNEILYPLTLIYTYSHYQLFNKYFNQQKLRDNRLELLSEILEDTYDHQSHLSSDIRFIILWSAVLSGKMMMSHDLLIVKALKEYAYCAHEDEIMRQYRPTIRATEISLGSMPGTELFDEGFNNHFWKEISEMTECKLFIVEIKDNDDHDMMNRYKEYVHKVMQYYEGVLRVFHPINKKAEVLFSILMYSFKRIKELIEHDLSHEISGRSIARSLTENLIMMKYLVFEESTHANIWEDFMSYGLGQFKLISSRYSESASSPKDSHVPINYIDAILSSETNDAFLNMDTRYFNQKKIRDKAIQVGEKELYDFYYDYDSQFEHGLWGAIRESVSVVCDNSSHRFHHSIDVEDKQKLTSVWKDCEMLMNKSIAFVHTMFSLPSELTKYE